jgi:AbrB family looped-hinge helix DNA binding protein
MRNIPAHSLSVATVGTKGQIVIPREVREKLGIGAGDKVVILLKEDRAAVLFPMEGMRAWLDKLSADFDEIKNTALGDENKERK